MKGPNKIQNVLTLKHSYQFYIKDLSDTSKFKVDYKTYRNICQKFNELLTQKIVEEGYIFNVPYRLGFHRIKKKKINYKNLKPDFGLYNESDGEFKNKHLNDHTGGYYCLFYWNKKNCIVKNRTAYCFIPTRANKRYLAKTIKDNSKEIINKYFE